MSSDAVAGQENAEYDPLLCDQEDVVQEGHWVILHFADGRRIFGQCLSNSRGKTPPVKINKRSYPTFNLIGLHYGTVLELSKNRLVPLPDGEELLPEISVSSDADPTMTYTTNASANMEQINDNRRLVDDNQSQALKSDDLKKLVQDGMDGSKIVQSLIDNSATFDTKTDFSKQKYIIRRQLKHQPRCRLVRCTGRTICEANHWKESRKLGNLLKIRWDKCCRMPIFVPVNKCWSTIRALSLVVWPNAWVVMGRC